MAQGSGQRRSSVKETEEHPVADALKTVARRTGAIISPEYVPNIFGYGIAGLGVCLGIVLVDPALKPSQVAVVAVLLGLSGAAFATAITGILRLETKVIVAGGPFVVFVLAFWAMMSAAAPGVLPDFSALFGKVVSRNIP